MIQDLHSHTYYSFCGRDDPRDVVEAAINGGFGMIGITDHNYGIGYGRFDVFTSPGAESFNGTYERTLRRYYDHIDLIRDKYAGKIEVKRGIELCTLKGIGPTKAAAIVAYRQSYGGFVCIEEIMEVKGIGEGTFEKIREFIYIGDEGRDL